MGINEKKEVINMRAAVAANDVDPITVGGLTEEYTDWLLKLGEGRLPFVQMKGAPYASDDLIEIPRGFLSENKDSFFSFVYGSGADVGKCVILCPTNAAVDEINNVILDRFANDETPVSFFSIDEYKNDENDDLFVPVDVLNSVTAPSLPPHELRLAIGAIVMLLRNLDVDLGLCNGTRLKIRGLQSYLIEAEILSGQFKNEIVYLP